MSLSQSMSLSKSISMPDLKPLRVQTPTASPGTLGTLAALASGGSNWPGGSPSRSPSKMKLAAQKMGLADAANGDATSPVLKVPAGPASPWRPPVSNIKVAKTEKPLANSLSKVELQPFEKAYIAANESEKLSYKIALPGEEYTSRYNFTATPEIIDKEKRGGQLISWVGVKGSRVGDSVAPSFQLPNGQVLRFFHASKKRNSRTPYDEPAEKLPETLAAVHMNRLPARPAPPFPTERDVPKITQTVELVAPTPTTSCRRAPA